MAMTLISRVPVNSGTAPKAPEAPTWSVRMAICGLQSSPNRKSVTETMRKKRSEFEQQRQDDADRGEDGDGRVAIRKTLTAPSTRLRARRSGLM